MPVSICRRLRLLRPQLRPRPQPRPAPQRLLPPRPHPICLQDSWGRSRRSADTNTQVHPHAGAGCDRRSRFYVDAPPTGGGDRDPDRRRGGEHADGRAAAADRRAGRGRGDDAPHAAPAGGAYGPSGIPFPGGRRAEHSSAGGGSHAHSHASPQKLAAATSQPLLGTSGQAAAEPTPVPAGETARDTGSTFLLGGGVILLAVALGGGALLLLRSRRRSGP